LSCALTGGKATIETAKVSVSSIAIAAVDLFFIISIFPLNYNTHLSVQILSVI
jgi:hypothetical protein